MRRFESLLVLLAFLLVVSGCGSIEVVEQPTTVSTVSPIANASPSTAVEPGRVESTGTTDQPTTTTAVRPPLLDGLPAPAVTLELDDQTTLGLVGVYEPVVLFFWATWCHNCHEMMPAIDQMASDFDGRVTVVAVARLSPLHEVETDVIEYLPSGATRWALDEDSSISEAFRVPGNPVAILVVGGVEVERWLGTTAVVDIETRLDETLALYG